MKPEDTEPRHTLRRAYRSEYEEASEAERHRAVEAEIDAADER